MKRPASVPIPAAMGLPAVVLKTLITCARRHHGLIILGSEPGLASQLLLLGILRELARNSNQVVLSLGREHPWIFDDILQVPVDGDAAPLAECLAAAHGQVADVLGLHDVAIGPESVDAWHQAARHARSRLVLVSCPGKRLAALIAALQQAGVAREMLVQDLLLVLTQQSLDSGEVLVDMLAMDDIRRDALRRGQVLQPQHVQELDVAGLIAGGVLDETAAAALLE